MQTICLSKMMVKKMIDKWIYGFFSALDKIGLMVDNLCQRMTRINMNYYFTGLLIIMLVILAFCGGPSVQ
jgi:hypothetical protein